MVSGVDKNKNKLVGTDLWEAGNGLNPGRWGANGLNKIRLWKSHFRPVCRMGLPGYGTVCQSRSYSRHIFLRTVLGGRVMLCYSLFKIDGIWNLVLHHCTCKHTSLANVLLWFTSAASWIWRQFGVFTQEKRRESPPVSTAVQPVMKGPSISPQRCTSRVVTLLNVAFSALGSLYRQETR